MELDEEWTGAPCFSNRHACKNTRVLKIDPLETFTSDNLLRVDFVDETRLFLQQGHFLSDLDPGSTLYAIAFGRPNF
jgi:hypothetical protein